MARGNKERVAALLHLGELWGAPVKNTFFLPNEMGYG
jgi:hypothetical protein